MTNKERYKRAFSALQSSGPLNLEVEEMAKLKKKHKANIAVAAAIICAVIIGGSGTAYAADLGGIREKISIWLYGNETEVEVTEHQEDGGYTFSYEHDGETVVMGGGGVSLDDNGNETWLSAEEVLAEMNGSANIEEDENGRVWVYYYDQQIDITDLFNEENICRITLMHEGLPAYLEITREGNGSYPFSQTDHLSDEEKELYSYVTTE